MKTPPRVPQAVVGNYSVISKVLKPTIPNMGICNCEGFGCEQWLAMVPKFRERICELAMCADRTLDLGDGETRTPAQAIRLLKELVEFIDKTCGQTAVIHTVSTDCQESC